MTTKQAFLVLTLSVSSLLSAQNSIYDFLFEKFCPRDSSTTSAVTRSVRRASTVKKEVAAVKQDTAADVVVQKEENDRLKELMASISSRYKRNMKRGVRGSVL